MQLLLNPTVQSEAAREGLESIPLVISRYRVFERIYREVGTATLGTQRPQDMADLREKYEDKVTQLYSRILEYQARAVCQFSSNLADRYLKNVFKVNDWKKMLVKIQTLDSSCNHLAGAMDADRADRLDKELKEQSSCIDKLLESWYKQHKVLKDVQETADKTLKTIEMEREEEQIRQQKKEEHECHQAFRNSIKYEEYKDRNRVRVPGTCKWFLEHPRFISWRDEQSSSLLWVSADPGCGKSVLSKALVDEKLVNADPTNATICYYFFKDDSSNQRSATKAMSALLHQLFSKKIALIKHALNDFRGNNDKLSGLFSLMWTILENAAADSDAGEITCILDALDECEEVERIKLIESLREFYSGPKKSNTRLKFLVTSRPYYDIERGFRSLTDNMPTIRLDGDGETEAITKEIDLVIIAEIPKIARDLCLDSSAQESLQQHLLRISNRTYLWLHMIFGVIRKSLGATTAKKLGKLVDELPKTVSEAYEAILKKIDDEYRELAMKLLHIIVVADRPLSLKEMNVALSIKEDTRSYEDLDLENDDSFRKTVRNLCGLFVSVIDSKVYLIHQTAKEFLVSKEECKEDAVRPASGVNSFPVIWEHSLEPRKSNFIMAKICISYLLFAEFESHPLVIVNDIKETVDQYTTRHAFLDYAAKHWADHFRGSKVTETALLKPMVDVCDTQSKRFTTWFQVYWINMYPSSLYPQTFTSLMVGSYFGHKALVKLLLENGADVDSKDSSGRTPLLWAIENGHKAVVELLLEKGANVDSKDSGGRTPLLWAAENGDKAVVELLLKKGADIESKDSSFSRTPLLWAAKNGHEAVVKLLLEKGANVDSKESNGRTPLLWAMENGYEAVVKLLLEKEVDLDSKDSNFSRKPLLWAAMNGCEAVVKLLLQKGADVESKDSSGRTPLLWAAVNGREAVVKLLLQKGADVDSKDFGNGQTPLLWAVIKRHEAVVKLLLEKGADVDSKSGRGRTALSWAAINGDEAVVKLLLEKGANVDSKDVGRRQTPLSYAAMNGHEAVVKLLLEKADVDSKSGRGQTALSWAAINGDEAVVKLLLKKGANVDSKDSSGLTPLSWATENGHKAVVKLLKPKTS
jgi:ankyrin repeat protein